MSAADGKSPDLMGHRFRKDWKVHCKAESCSKLGWPKIYGRAIKGCAIDLLPFCQMISLVKLVYSDKCQGIGWVMQFSSCMITKFDQTCMWRRACMTKPRANWNFRTQFINRQTHAASEWCCRRVQKAGCLQLHHIAGSPPSDQRRTSWGNRNSG